MQTFSAKLSYLISDVKNRNLIKSSSSTHPASIRSPLGQECVADRAYVSKPLMVI